MRGASQIQLLVHHVLDNSVIDHTAEEMSVDKKAGGACQSKTLPFLQILLYCRCFGSVVEAGVELIAIQFQNTRMLLEGIDVELFAVEEDVMIFPKLALLAGTTRCFGGF